MSKNKNKDKDKTKKDDISQTVNDYRPPCPVIFFERGEKGKKQIFTIHCKKLDVNIECYVSTAIIKLEGIWTNPTKDTLDCVFAVPTSGTVMNVTLQIGDERVLTTAIISKQDAQEIIQKHAKNNKKKKKQKTEELKTDDNIREQQVTPEEQSPYEQYVPDLFRLPFGNIKPGETIKLTCEYLESLNYYKKGYVLSVPLYFPSGTIIKDKEWNKIVNVKCSIYALSENTQPNCWTHNIKSIKNDDENMIEINTVSVKKVDNIEDYPHYNDFEPIEFTGRDFELSYNIKSKEIVGHCIKQEDVFEQNTGSLVLFVTPPTKIEQTFGRAFFFLLDRSGSMVNEPYREATRALQRALDRLRQTDQFNVCAFDHRQAYYSPTLMNASQENITNCKQWVKQYQPERGGTTMDAPIKRAIETLENSDLLPFIVLITDGAVQNEREICNEIEKRCNASQNNSAPGQSPTMRTRIITLGIGSYCNWYFLKMLSKMGRGFNDIVVYKERIYHKIDHLLRMAATPVLTDIELGIKADETEIYPFPVPDLFVHSPIVVAARYKINSIDDDDIDEPKKILVRGFDPLGKNQQLKCDIKENNNIPVDKIFIKEQIDLLTAQAWFTKDVKIENKIVDVSVNNGVPSKYTNMVAFETTQKKLKKEQEQMNKEIDDQKTGLLDKNNDNKKSKKSVKSSKLKEKLKNNKKSVAALAVVGTAAIIGVGVMSFGNVQATMDNVPTLGGGGDDVDVGDPDCCEDCGDCDCDCDDGCDCDDCIIL